MFSLFIIPEEHPEPEPAVEDIDSAADIDPILLTSFLHDAANAIAVLEAWIGKEAAGSDEDLSHLLITLHGMKSALANIGETELAQVAGLLNDAGKQGDMTIINRDVPVFLKTLQDLVQKLVLDESCDSTDDDADYLRNKLETVVKLCSVYSRKEIMDILDELGQSKCSRQMRLTLQNISSAVLYSDFEEAAKIASSYAASLVGLTAKV